MDTHVLKEGEEVAKRSIFVLIILAVLKMTAGYLTGLTVIYAGAVNTFSDTLGIFASYLGLRLSRKSANKKFEYGYYKVETLAAFLISLGIIYLGYKIFASGIDIFINPKIGQFRSFAITITIISIISSRTLEKRLKTIAEKTNSLSLLANAKNKKIAIFSEIIILASVVANYNKIPYMEGVITMMLSLFILKEGIFSAKESLFFLLDYWNDPVLLRKIRKILNQEKGLIISIKKLRLRRAGTFIFGEAFVEINPFAGIGDLRETLDLLSVKVKGINKYIKDFSIYTHIQKAEKIKVAVPIEENHGLNSRIAPTLSKTKYYLFADLNDTRILKHYVKKIDFNHKKPLEFADFLKKEKINILIDNKLNSLIYYNLRRIHHILIYPDFSDVKKADQALKLLLIDT